VSENGKEQNLPAEACADPLYLFFCSLLWQRGDSGSGWELVKAAHSRDERERGLAVALLAKTCDVRMPAAAKRGRPAHPQRSPIGGNHFAGIPGRHYGIDEASMNTPYGLEIVESCLRCKLRQQSWFCGLSPEVLKSFSNASHQSTYPGAALLFLEGQMPRGVFVLCSGRVKLSTTSREGKVLILKIAEAGDLLGLSAVISGTPYELCAETSGPCQVNFIEREALIAMVRKNGELGLHAAQALSQEFQSAYRDIHDLVLARSSAGKLAKLLLSWTEGRESEARDIRIRSSLTHEEMAQMIGASRETVTRLLSTLKKKQLISLEGSTLVIHNRTALEALAA
jgi:CRP/FNR family transcriptional regulator, cyclic AMP receptor protein